MYYNTGTFSGLCNTATTSMLKKVKYFYSGILETYWILVFYSKALIHQEELIPVV
jgi:hypothetical protein